MSAFDLNALDNMTDIDGKPILGWISAFINGHVDCAKDPWPPRTNANPFTYNISNLLLRTGWGKNTIFFLRQPIMLAMAQAYMRASSEYMSDGTSQFRRQQQAIDNVVFGEDSKYHLENVQIDGFTVLEWMDIIESQDGEKDILKQSLNATLSTILTRENMLAQAKTPLGKMGDIQFQAAVYLAYKQFDKYANALSNLVKYCKIDTKKHGKSLAEQLVWYEGYNDLFNNGETGKLFNSAALQELKKFSYIGVKTENAIKATKQIIGGQFFSGSRQFIKAIENLSKLVGNEHRYETVSFVEAATKAISASIKSEYFNYYVNKLFGDSTYVRDLVNGSSEQHNVRYHYDKKAPYIEVDEDMIYPLRTYIGKPINISWKTKSGSQMKAYPNVIVAISGNKVYLQKEIQFNSKGRRSPLTVDANIDVQFTQGNNTIYDRIGALKTLIENNSALADLKGNILLRDIILAATQKYTPSHKRIAGEASDTYDDLKFIKLETFFEDNGDKTDQYIRAWDSLLRYTNDNERLQNAIRKLANDLVIYAFITSGDTKGSTKLFQYVPDSWRNGEFNPEGMKSYAEFIRNKLDELNGYGETKIDLDDVILNNWQNDQFVPRYRVDDKAEQQKLTPIYTDGRNTYGYPVVIQGMNIEKPADKNHMPKVNVVIDPTKAPQYIKITRDYKHRNSQRQYSIYKFHSVAQTADGIRYPIYVKVEPKGITIKSSGGTYMVTEYGRSDRLDKAENSTIPELFELLYTAQNFQDQLRGMPKSDLRDSNILQDLRRFAELDMAEKMIISRRSYSANMDIAQTQAVQFNDTDAQSQASTSVISSTTEQNPKAAQRLLDTGNTTLTHTQDKSKWKTEFPRLLMEVRDELRKSQSNSVDQTSSIVNITNDPQEIISLNNVVIRPFVHTFEDGSKKEFKSIAQAFQYIKATYADPAVNENIIKQIEQTTDPSDLIDLGDSIKQLDVKSWDNDSYNIMTQLTKESFEQNPSAVKTVKNELHKAGVDTSSKPQSNKSYNSITISTGYTKGEPEDNPNTDYVFTENAEAALAVSSRGHGLDKSGIFDQEEFPFKGSVKLNVSDVHQLNSAAVRTDAKGNITQNAYGIVVKKYQHDANGKFVAQSGCFEDTDEDFKKFKSINNIVFKDIEQSKNANIVFPSQIALRQAALPLQFAAWLHNQLEQRFGLQTNIERSKKASYEGYGLRVIGVGIKTNTSVDTNSQSSTEDSKPKTDENSKPIQQINLTAGQETAKKAILNFIKTADASKGEYFTLTGKAGTGKTTLIQEVIREIAKDNPYQIFVVSALAHKAVQVIYGKTKKSSKFVSASTVASLLGMKLDQEAGLFKSAGKNAKIKLKHDSILFVDEASMLNEQNIKLLMDAAIRTDSKVIFLGDPGQLPPIRTGDLVKYGTDSLSPVFKTQKDEYSAGLTERVRQGEGSPILDYADTFWNYSTTEGQTDRRVNDEDMSRVENTQGSIEFINEQQVDKIVPLFKQAVETNNPSLVKIVAYHNKAVKQWNQIIRRNVYGDEYSPNPLPGDILMMTDTYNDPASDDAKPLLFNSEDISVISTGPIRTVYRVQLMDATIKDPRGKIITVPLIIPTKQNMDEFNNNKRLLWNEAQKYKNTDRGKYKRALDMYWSYGTEWAHVEYGYAITSHKSQGSTYDVSIVDSADINSNGFMSDISKARSIYTAITRARNSAVILRDKLGTLDVDLKQLNDRINGYKDGSVTPPAQITPDTVDNVGNTYKENVATLESDKTILSNEEILKLRPFTGNNKAPRIAVASEHTDPVFFAKKIKDFFEGKTSVQPRFGQPITAKDIDALYIITKHDGLPLRDILSIKIPKIIHFSITGLGGTKYEPGVMPYNELLDRIGDYIKQGLDPSMVTVRIDPIVPGVTSKHVIENIIKRASSMGIKNIRFSIMDFYATTAQFTEANGFDYSKYYVPQTNADGSQRVLLVSRDGRSFSRIDGVSYRQVGKSIAVLQSYGAESKVYLQGKSGNVWVKTVQTSNITDDVIKSKDGWTVLNDKQVMNDQVASRVKAGVHLQKLYETHAKKPLQKTSPIKLKILEINMVLRYRHVLNQIFFHLEYLMRVV